MEEDFINGGVITRTDRKLAKVARKFVYKIPYANVALIIANTVIVMFCVIGSILIIACVADNSKEAKDIISGYNKEIKELKENNENKETEEYKNKEKELEDKRNKKFKSMAVKSKRMLIASAVFISLGTIIGFIKFGVVKHFVDKIPSPPGSGLVDVLKKKAIKIGMII